MMNVPWISGFQAVLNTSASGEAAFWSFCSTCWNTGVSSTCRRTHSPMMTITMDSRNGTRQPQAMNASSKSPDVCPRTVTRIRNRPLASRNPNGAPSWGHMPAHARRPLAAVSVDSRAAPDHSPPRPRPWQKRIRASSAGAQMPACA